MAGMSQRNKRKTDR